ncbi:MAG: aspartate 1-decarboxylase [bacterium]
MFREMCRAKIHRLRVTETNVDYEGSITLDEALLKEADILPGEKVQVVNVNNGNRFDTYVIKGGSGSGTVCINGAAARLCAVNDVVIVISYATMEEGEARTFKPNIVIVDNINKILGGAS